MVVPSSCVIFGFADPRCSLCQGVAEDLAALAPALCTPRLRLLRRQRTRIK